MLRVLKLFPGVPRGPQALGRTCWAEPNQVWSVRVCAALRLLGRGVC
jgi:hypothetical protein